MPVFSYSLQCNCDAAAGRLGLYLDEEQGGKGGIAAMLVQPRPGSVFRIVNWGELKGHSSDLRSGAEVSLTGSR